MTGATNVTVTQDETGADLFVDCGDVYIRVQLTRAELRRLHEQITLLLPDAPRLADGGTP